MAAPSGIAAQVGYKAESTYGTGVTVDRFVPLVSESVSNTIERMESAGIVAGRRTMLSRQWKSGTHAISGTIQHELTDNTMGLLFDQAMGTTNTSGAGPYTHVITPTSLTGKSFTTQIGRPDTGGTVRPFTYAGCKITALELAGQAGSIATVGFDIVAQSETTGTALATASYGASDVLLAFTGGALTVAGSAPSAVISGFTLNIDNGLKTDRYTAGATTIREPLEADLRTITGTIDCEFDSLTELNRYLNGTEAALVLSFTAGANSVTWDGNVRFDGATPNVSGRDVLTLSMPWKAVSDTSDAVAHTLTIVNGDSTI